MQGKTICPEYECLRVTAESPSVGIDGHRGWFNLLSLFIVLKGRAQICSKLLPVFVHLIEIDSPGDRGVSRAGHVP